MKTKRTLLVAGVVSVIVLAGSLARAQTPLVFGVRGTVRIQQDVPCGAPVDVTATIADGRMDIAPRGRDIVSPTFDLTRLDVFVTPFSVERDCLGFRARAAFSEIGFRLARFASFQGVATGGSESGQFKFTIPKNQVLIYETVVDSAVPQPETRFRRPSDDIIGLIDMRARTVQLRVPLSAEMHFQMGCVKGKCRIDETDHGTQTADLLGAGAGGGPTPPTAMCTMVSRSNFRVSASDNADPSPAIRLGPYALTNGETIQILESSEPGVRLLDKARGSLRQFQVGRGEAFIVATNAAGLSSFAACR